MRHMLHASQVEQKAAAAVHHNNNKLLEWEEKVAHFHKLESESKHTEAKESLLRYTLGGSVEADKQWIAQQTDDRHKQESYTAEISHIEEIIAKTKQSMEKCNSQ
jgi:hypothetical protein